MYIKCDSETGVLSISFHPIQFTTLLKIINDGDHKELLDYLINDLNYKYDSRYNMRFIGFDNIKLFALVNALKEHQGDSKETAKNMLTCIEASKASLIYAKLRM